MTVTFIDTSFLLAMVLEPDAHHERALTWRKRVQPPFLTTDYVLIEFLDALVQIRFRPRAVRTVESLQSDRNVRIVPADAALFAEALRLFKTYDDKTWSLTDCSSFVVMRREGITDALTSDHDFEQAGFRALLRTEPP